MIVMKRYLQRGVLLTILWSGLSGCLGIPEGAEPVEGFELDRYLGTWYEIARLDHSFERGLSDVTATYTQREGGGVKVINRGFDQKDNDWQEAEGKAFFIGDPSIGQLKVSFFGPFYGAYNIVALDRDTYQWSLVAGPDTGYLWVLARTPELDKSILDKLVETAASLGFKTNELIYVSHDRNQQ